MCFVKHYATEHRWPEPGVPMFSPRSGVKQRPRRSIQQSGCARNEKRQLGTGSYLSTLPNCSDFFSSRRFACNVLPSKLDFSVQFCSYEVRTPIQKKTFVDVSIVLPLQWRTWLVLSYKQENHSHKICSYLVLTLDCICSVHRHARFFKQRSTWLPSCLNRTSTSLRCQTRYSFRWLHKCRRLQRSFLGSKGFEFYLIKNTKIDRILQRLNSSLFRSCWSKQFSLLCLRTAARNSISLHR